MTTESVASYLKRFYPPLGTNGADLDAYRWTWFCSSWTSIGWALTTEDLEEVEEYRESLSLGFKPGASSIAALDHPLFYRSAERK